MIVSSEKPLGSRRLPRVDDIGQLTALALRGGCCGSTMGSEVTTD